ncbi:MAG: hypothetical protein GX250_03360 [Clostridiales bacterium]|jgi:parvulin-like peptidyl-prolyl isomerase|nr:hypothetical protein [Clostridiales bacterium]
MKRALCTALAAVMLASTLFGCAPAEPATTPEPTPEPTDTYKEITEINSTLYSEDTLMFKVGDSEVYWPELLYWICSHVIAMTRGYQLDWSTVYNETDTIQDFIMDASVDAVSLYRTVEVKAAEMGVSLSEQDMDEIESEFESAKALAGGEEAFNEELGSSQLTQELYRYLLKISTLYYKLFVELCGESAEKYSDSDAISYANENGYMMAKHILLLSKEDETENNEVKADMEAILSELKAAGGGEALFTKFDELMNARSEDAGGLMSYPGGYLFREGDMVAEFFAATMALDEGELSEIVETNYGYHIILRLPVDPDSLIFNTPYPLRYTAAYASFESLAQQWRDEAEIVPTKELDEINFSDIFK